MKCVFFVLGHLHLTVIPRTPEHRIVTIVINTDLFTYTIALNLLEL